MLNPEKLHQADMFSLLSEDSVLGWHPIGPGCRNSIVVRDMCNSEGWPAFMANSHNGDRVCMTSMYWGWVALSNADERGRIRWNGSRSTNVMNWHYWNLRGPISLRPYNQLREGISSYSPPTRSILLFLLCWRWESCSARRNRGHPNRGREKSR